VMTAIVQSEYGGPEVLKRKDDVPKPTPGPRDLVVAVKAIATNPIDTKKRAGFGMPPTGKVAVGWNIPPTMTAVGGRVFHHEVQDLIIGWDAAGVVESVGAEVQHYKVGDEVYFAGDISRQGCYAQYVAVDERIVGRKPKKLNFVDAAALPLTSITSWEALLELLKIPIPRTKEEEEANSKKTLLVYSGAGGVGAIATQIASRILKVKVISTASREDSVSYCKKMGASHVINHKHSIVEELKKIGIPEVNYVFNTFALNAALFDDFVKVLKPFGAISSVSTAFEPLNFIPLFVKAGTFSLELMFTKALFRDGELMETQRNLLNHVADYVDQGVLESHATTRLKGFESIQEAHHLQSSGTAIGKIVIDLQ